MQNRLSHVNIVYFLMQDKYLNNKNWTDLFINLEVNNQLYFIPALAQTQLGI